MKTRLLLTSIYFILSKIGTAQLQQVGPSNIPIPAAVVGQKTKLSSATNIPLPFGGIAPKCYPDTAKAYFLPAPPSSPIVSILDTNTMDISSNFRSSFQEPSPKVTQNLAVNHPSFQPPRTPVLPELTNEVPSLLQDRLSSLAEPAVKVCDTCGLVAKLPIYNFDQELLQGFLSGLGM